MQDSFIQKDQQTDEDVVYIPVSEEVYQQLLQLMIQH